MSIKCVPNIPFGSDDAPVNVNGGTPVNLDFVGTKEFQADFEKNLSILMHASTNLRPDTVSQDYKTAFTLGPVALGDISQGPIAFVWRCRVDNSLNKVYITRVSDSRTSWGVEIELFGFAGVAIDEIDIAFDQNSNVVICAQRATGASNSPEVWLYWFKPSLLAFTFESFGVGRTPRVLLDSPLDVANSDVLLFYVNDVTQNFCYRQQRDTYNIAYNIVTNPALGAVSNKYIEDVVKHEDSRVVIIYSARDVVTGKYTLNEIQSALYPYNTEIDVSNTNLMLQALVVLLIVTDYIAKDIDTQIANLILQALTVVTTVFPVSYTAFDVDSLTAELAIQNLLLATIVMLYTAFDIDTTTTSLALQTLTIADVVILYTAFDVDTMSTNFSLQALTLA